MAPFPSKPSPTTTHTQRAERWADAGVSGAIFASIFIMAFLGLICLCGRATSQRKRSPARPALTEGALSPSDVELASLGPSQSTLVQEPSRYTTREGRTQRPSPPTTSSTVTEPPPAYLPQATNEVRNDQATPKV